MAKVMHLKGLTTQIDDMVSALKNKQVEEFNAAATTSTPVSQTKVDTAVKSLEKARSDLAKICQQGVFGVKVK
jgi:hypothetical protein